MGIDYLQSSQNNLIIKANGSVQSTSRAGCHDTPTQKYATFFDVMLKIRFAIGYAIQ